MTAYKLLDQELKSNDGQFQWEIGKTYTIDKPGNKMCSDEVFHCYNHPVLAVLFNRIHADIQNPRLFEIEVPEFVNDDKMKFASKSQKLIKEIDLPVISVEQRAEFAIRIVKLVHKNKEWNAWADKWLSGEDRSAANAYSTAHAASWSAAFSAAWAAASTTNADYFAAAVDSIADAVDSAARTAVVTNDDFIRIIEEIMNR